MSRKRLSGAARRRLAALRRQELDPSILEQKNLAREQALLKRSLLAVPKHCSEPQPSSLPGVSSPASPKDSPTEAALAPVQVPIEPLNQHHLLHSPQPSKLFWARSPTRHGSFYEAPAQGHLYPLQALGRPSLWPESSAYQLHLSQFNHQEPQRHHQQQRYWNQEQQGRESHYHMQQQPHEFQQHFFQDPTFHKPYPDLSRGHPQHHVRSHTFPPPSHQSYPPRQGLPHIRRQYRPQTGSQPGGFLAGQRKHGPRVPHPRHPRAALDGRRVHHPGHGSPHSLGEASLAGGYGFEGAAEGTSVTYLPYPVSVEPHPLPPPYHSPPPPPVTGGYGTLAFSPAPPVHFLNPSPPPVDFKSPPAPACHPQPPSSTPPLQADQNILGDESLEFSASIDTGGSNMAGALTPEPEEGRIPVEGEPGEIGDTQGVAHGTAKKEPLDDDVPVDGALAENADMAGRAQEGAEKESHGETMGPSEGAGATKEAQEVGTYIPPPAPILSEYRDGAVYYTYPDDLPQSQPQPVPYYHTQTPASYERQPSPESYPQYAPPGSPPLLQPPLHPFTPPHTPPMAFNFEQQHAIYLQEFYHYTPPGSPPMLQPPHHPFTPPVSPPLPLPYYHQHPYPQRPHYPHATPSFAGTLPSSPPQAVPSFEPALQGQKAPTDDPALALPAGPTTLTQHETEAAGASVHPEAIPPPASPPTGRPSDNEQQVKSPVDLNTHSEEERPTKEATPQSGMSGKSLDKSGSSRTSNQSHGSVESKRSQRKSARKKSTSPPQQRPPRIPAVRVRDYYGKPYTFYVPDKYEGPLCYPTRFFFQPQPRLPYSAREMERQGLTYGPYK